MDRRNLRTVLRHATSIAGPSPADDAELLDRFRRDRDEAAFAELVRRHGRIVWAVCRPLLLTDADAEDAFQATFLVLIRNAGSIRDGHRLGPWLHGVAVRVCSRARRAHARRKKHELKHHAQSNGAVIPDSAWDAALAAVHEEIARLPESQRVPFILCCLEGLGVTEAARRLGWKLGTLSGRLTRAKQSLMARLDARGLAAGSIAAIVTAGSASAGIPLALAERTAALVHLDVTIPATILHLSQGVVDMNLSRIKLLAAAAVLTGGLATSIGSGWLATVGAQSTDPVNKSTLALQADRLRFEELQKQLQAERDRANRLEQLAQAAATQAEQEKAEKLTLRAIQELARKQQTARWEYRYLPQSAAYGFKQAEFEKQVADVEGQGWDFVGVVNMRWANYQGGTPTPEKGGVTLPTLVFRKPTGETGKTAASLVSRLLAQRNDEAQRLTALEALRQAEIAKQNERQVDDRRVTELRDQIQVLQARLAEMNRAKHDEIQIEAGQLGGVTPTEMQNILLTLARSGFGYDARNPITMRADEKGLTISGPPVNVTWAKEMIKKLVAKDPSELAK